MVVLDVGSSLEKRCIEASRSSRISVGYLETFQSSPPLFFLFVVEVALRTFHSMSAGQSILHIHFLLDKPRCVLKSKGYDRAWSNQIQLTSTKRTEP